MSAEQHLYIRDTRLFKDGQIIFFCVLKNVVLLCIEKIDGNKLFILKIDVIWYITRYLNFNVSSYRYDFLITVALLLL